MNREDIKNMKAGYELDLLVATTFEPPTFKVPDFREFILERNSKWISPLGFWYGDIVPGSFTQCMIKPLPFSTDINCAYQIIVFIRNTKQSWEVDSFANELEHLCSGQFFNFIQLFNPELICKAACLMDKE